MEERLIYTVLIVSSYFLTTNHTVSGYKYGISFRIFTISNTSPGVSILDQSIVPDNNNVTSGNSSVVTFSDSTTIIKFRVGRC